MFVLVFLFSTILAAQQNPVQYKDLIRKNTDNFYTVPIGLCEDYPEETTTMEIIRKDFEVLRQNGINLLRVSFGWDAMQDSAGDFNVLFWDEFVRMAVDEYKITLIPYICYTPAWATSNPEDSLNFWSYPPKDFGAFASFLKILVNRYKDRIKSWELWNEPDLSIYWNGTSEEFARFVKAGAGAIREADSGAIVVLGGLSYSTDFLLELFREYNLGDYVDVVNIHNYYETWSRYPIERIQDYINEFADIIKRYGKNQALWMAEVGYSTFRMHDDRVSDVYNAYYEYEHTEEYQAVQLVKTLSLILNTGKVSAVAWYEIKDLPADASIIGEQNNRYLGIMHPDYKPKAAVRALKYFNELFSKPFRVYDRNIRITKNNDSNVHLCSFSMKDGRIVLVTWLQTVVPGMKGDSTGAVKDNRREKITIELPSAAVRKGEIYDHLGNKEGEIKITGKGNSSVIKDMEIRGKEVMIVILRPR